MDPDSQVAFAEKARSLLDEYDAEWRLYSLTMVESSYHNREDAKEMRNQARLDLNRKKREVLSFLIAGIASQEKILVARQEPSASV